MLCNIFIKIQICLINHKHIKLTDDVSSDHNYHLCDKRRVKHMIVARDLMNDMRTVNGTKIENLYR